MQFRALALALALAGLSALAFVGCGDDDDDGGGDGGPTTVDVTLSEFVVEPDPVSVAAGDVTFAATNEGEEEHELVIAKSDLAPDALPTKDDGSVDEEGEGVEFVDEIEEFEPGGTEELTVNLEAGKYVLFCNLVEEEESGETESHYGEGMTIGFTVE